MITAHEPDLDVDNALDITLALTLPEVYRTLVAERGCEPAPLRTMAGEFPRRAELLGGADLEFHSTPEHLQANSPDFTPTVTGCRTTASKK